MNVRSLKLASAAAGVLFLVGAAPSVFAQTSVLNVTASAAAPRFNPHVSIFTFNQSLILNSIGIPDADGTTFMYKIGESASYTTVTDTLGAAENGFRYFNFTNPQTYAAGTKVMIFSTKDLSEFDTRWYTHDISSTNDVGVTHTYTFGSNNDLGTLNRAAGNIKVSNPGSNVAPEPGSFALALTGGAALAGIALRRRRNAA
jgi:hypothetical protein